MMVNELKIKVILLGDGSVGKTSIANRYTQGKFSSRYKPSLGVDFMVKRIEREGRKLKLMVFDTAGQEFISTLRKRYYYGASGAVIVFDITYRKSFEGLGRWVEELRSEVGELPTVIVGNKIDLEKERVVSEEEGKEFAKSNNAIYMETSALTGEWVSEVFEIFIDKTF